jgi:hypothetical protein
VWGCGVSCLLRQELARATRAVDSLKTYIASRDAALATHPGPQDVRVLTALRDCAAMDLAAAERRVSILRAALASAAAPVAEEVH